MKFCVKCKFAVLDDCEVCPQCLSTEFSKEKRELTDAYAVDESSVFFKEAKCPQCGHPVGKEAFCPVCNARLLEKEEREALKRAQSDTTVIEVNKLSTTLLLAKIFLFVSIAINVLYTTIFVVTMVSTFKEVSQGLDPMVAAVALAISISIPVLFVLVSIILSIVTINKINKRQPMSTAFKVIILLFSSLISGILLLVDKSNE